MQKTLETFAQQANFTRYHHQQAGHYESFFQRANHPTRPLAFWIRYTIFSPKNRPQDALGEIWAVYFNGDTGHHIVIKQEVPFSMCVFSPSEFFVQIAEAQLRPGSFSGKAQSQTDAISWDMTFTDQFQPLMLLPLPLYETQLPAAKSLVGSPLARYHGQLTVNGEMIPIDNWVGSQNHNWGSKHTDEYAWGQVAGFDTHPQSFLEVATARLKVGPLWTPYMTLLVLRHDHREFSLNSLGQSLRAKGSFQYFSWNFALETKDVTIVGTISAIQEDFVGLDYYNPPGGHKQCLNTKIASCELHLKDKLSGKEEVFLTKNRAAFEILTDDQNHGIAIHSVSSQEKLKKE